MMIVSQQVCLIKQAPPGFIHSNTFRRVAIGVLLSLLLLWPGRRNIAAPPAIELLVKLRPGTAHLPFAMQPLSVPGWVRLATPANLSERIQAELSRHPDVLVVEPNLEVTAALTPNDPGWSAQWAPALIGMPAVWDVTAGITQVVVAVIDSGMDMAHPDLSGQVWVNPGEIASNGLDDDDNGYVDDIHGWRFLGTDQSNNLQDGYGHGTHVAGIVAARGHNGLGVAGIAWNCPLMILKVLQDSNGSGTFADVAQAIVYATDNGVRVINLSLGGPTNSAIMEDAVEYADAHDVLVVAAAGNFNACAAGKVLYPAASPHALAVAATNPADQRISSSCYGPEVDLAAPGEGIYSTCIGGSYCTKTGTSMAAPHAAGLAALIRSMHPTYTNTQVIQTLATTARDIEQPGWDMYTGWGRIQAAQAISNTLFIFYMPLIYK